MAAFEPITSAPTDGTEVQLIDVHADTPRWGVGFYMQDYGAFFSGYILEYEEICDEIEAGDFDPAELEEMFWSAPTHWAPVLSIPGTEN